MLPIDWLFVATFFLLLQISLTSIGKLQPSLPPKTFLGNLSVLIDAVFGHLKNHFFAIPSYCADMSALSNFKTFNRPCRELISARFLTSFFQASSEISEATTPAGKMNTFMENVAKSSIVFKVSDNAILEYLREYIFRHLLRMVYLERTKIPICWCHSWKNGILSASNLAYENTFVYFYCCRSIFANIFENSMFLSNILWKSGLTNSIF